MRTRHIVVATLALVLAFTLTACNGNSVSSTTDSATNGMGIESDIAYDGAGGGSYITESGTSSNTSSNMYTSDSMSEDNKETGNSGGASIADDNVLSTEKMVYSADLVIETLDFDKSMAVIDNIITESGAFVQEESTEDNRTIFDYYNESNTGRTAFIVLRVRSDGYSSVIEDLNEAGQVKSRDQTADNITTYYSDIEGQLSLYRSQLSALQSLYDRTETLTDIMDVQNKIIETENSIYKLENQLSNMDMDVEYSTITIRLREVSEYTLSSYEKENMSFLDKLEDVTEASVETFIDFLEGIVFMIVMTFWYIIIIAVVIVIVFYIRHKYVQNRISKFAVKHTGFYEYCHAHDLKPYKVLKNYELLNQMGRPVPDFESYIGQQDVSNDTKQ